MNSINEIAKYKYEFNNNSPVNLDEYIILYDEALDERYLIFKLYNNLSEILHKAECRVRIYNENNFLLEDIKFKFNGDYSSNEYFVPEFKLKINSKITSLKFDVEYLEFETLKYEDGEIKKIPQTMDDFMGDETPDKVVVKKQNKWTKKQDKLKYKTTKKVVKKDNKRKYITDVKKANRTNLPIVLTVIFSIIVIAYFVGALILYKRTTNVLSDMYCDYRITNDGAISLVENYNETRSLSVPDEIDGRKVTKITKEAFKNNKKIEEITLSYYVEIGESAFENCENLKTINNSYFITRIDKNAFKGTKVIINDLINVGYIGEDAFSNNPTTKELYMPNVKLGSKSLSGYTNLEVLEYRELESSKSLNEIFGENNNSINTLKKIITYNDSSYNTFDNLTKLDTVFLYGDNTTLRSNLLTQGKLSYIRMEASTNTIMDRLGNPKDGTIKTLHLNLSRNYNKQILKNLSANLLVLDGGSVTTDVLNNGNIDNIYFGKGVDYSTVDFNNVLQKTNLILIFEGNVPQTITSLYSRVRGNVSRSNYGIEN